MRHANSPWEECTTELSLDEELGVELAGGGVEGQTVLSRVDVVGSRNRVAETCA